MIIDENLTLMSFKKLKILKTEFLTFNILIE